MGYNALRLHTPTGGHIGDVKPTTEALTGTAGYFDLNYVRGENRIGGMSVRLFPCAIPDGWLVPDSRIEVWRTLDNGGVTDAYLQGDTCWFLREWEFEFYDTQPGQPERIRSVSLFLEDALSLLARRVVAWHAQSGPQYPSVKQNYIGAMLWEIFRENFGDGVGLYTNGTIQAIQNDVAKYTADSVTIERVESLPDGRGQPMFSVTDSSNTVTGSATIDLTDTVPFGGTMKLEFEVLKPADPNDGANVAFSISGEDGKSDYAWINPVTGDHNFGAQSSTNMIIIGVDAEDTGDTWQVRIDIVRNNLHATLEAALYPAIGPLGDSYVEDATIQHGNTLSAIRITDLTLDAPNVAGGKSKSADFPATTRDRMMPIALADWPSGGPILADDFSFQNVLSVMQELCDASAAKGTRCVFDVVYTPEDGGFEFQIWLNQRGEDLTERGSPNNAVIFGLEYGNIEKARLRVSYRDEATWAYIGGSSLGELRSLGAAVNYPDGFNKSPFYPIEVFEEGEDTVQDAVLTTQAEALLKERGPKVHLTGQIRDVGRSRFGRDYDYGYVVTAQAASHVFDAHITEYQVRVKDGEEVISIPLAGDVLLENRIA